MIINNLAYYELQPAYECYQQAGDSGDLAWSPCTREEFCPELGGTEMEYRVDWSNDKSLHNWVERLGMQCTPKVYFGMMGSIVFAGWCFASLFVPRLADIYGRRWPFIINMFVQAIIIALIIFSKDATYTTVLLFFIGMCAAGRWTNIQFCSSLRCKKA